MKKFIKKALSVLMAVTMLGAVIGHAALTTPTIEGTLLAYVTDFQADDDKMEGNSIKFLTGFCAGESGVGSPILSDRTNTEKWVATINESGTTKLTGCDYIVVPKDFADYTTEVDVETDPIVSFKLTEAKKVYVAVPQGDGPTDWLNPTKDWTKTDATFVINEESKLYDVWAKDYGANSTVNLGRPREIAYYPYVILFGGQSAVVEPDEPDEPDEPADEMSAVTFNTEAPITNIPYVSNVRVVSTGITSNWRAETLAVNGRTIADRIPTANKSHKIVTADESLIGMDYITMPMDMCKVDDAAPLLKFTVNKDTVVRVAVRSDNIPSWLLTAADSGWVNESRSLTICEKNKDVKANVYAKEFESGASVELGVSGSYQPYMILLEKNGEALPIAAASRLTEIKLNDNSAKNVYPYLSGVSAYLKYGNNATAAFNWKADVLAENTNLASNRVNQYPLSNIPQALVGMDYISMPLEMKDVAATETEMIRIDLTKDTTVRIVVNAGEIPSWISAEGSGWERENSGNLCFTYSGESTSLAVYKKSFKSGQTAVLGATARNWYPYMILLKAKSEISIGNQAAFLAENNVTVTAGLTSAFGSETGLVIAALYDGDGAFVDTKYVSKTVAVGTPADIELTFENVPELKSGAKVKLMFCDSFMSITPICASVDAAINQN